MKAIIIHEAGPPENLLLAVLPDPEPGLGEVLVRVSYAGINHGDVIRRKRGLFPGNTPPYVLGLEGVGSLVKLGKGVCNLKVNQRVGFLVESGAYGQLIRVPATQVFPLPETIAESVVAGSICVGTTAWQLLRLASPQRGQFFLVHGATGGVGSALIQLCKKHPGVHVIATVGEARKVAQARLLGADEVINYERQDFAESVLEITGGGGCHTIFDGVGKTVVDGNFRCLRKGGLLLYYGSPSGHPQFPAEKVLMNSLRIEGFVIFHLFGYPNLWSSGIKAVLGSLSDGSLKMSVDVLPMDDVGRAHALIEERKVAHKLVLDMR